MKPMQDEMGWNWSGQKGAMICIALLSLRLNCRISPSLQLPPALCRRGFCRSDTCQLALFRPALVCKPAAGEDSLQRQRRSTYPAKCRENLLSHGTFNDDP